MTQIRQSTGLHPLSEETTITETKISQFWWRWLVAASIFTILAGVLIALVEPAQTLLQSLYYGFIFGDGAYSQLDTAQIMFQDWLYGIIGSLMIGWGTIMLFVVWYPFRRGERWSWYALLVSLVIWFLPDSYMSAINQVPENVLLNIGFLVMLGLPLIGTYSAFHGQAEPEFQIE